MDAKQKRFYRREWKVNQPYLPKSTSLPLLRLIPSHRVVFICKQCGFSNLLVPICLWCCWSSVEARHDFEASARKRVRRVARSAPRLFGKPGSTLISRQDVAPAGKHPPRKGPSEVSAASTPSHMLGSIAVKADTTTVGPSPYQNTQTSYSQPSSFFRGTQGGEQVIRDWAKANSEIKAKSGIGGPFRPGSSENKLGPLTNTVTFERPRLKADSIANDHTQEGHEGWAKDVSCDFALPSSSPRSPPGFNLLEPCPQLSDRATPLTTCLLAPVHSEVRSSSPAPNLIGTMKIDALVVDTRRVTFTVSGVEQSLLGSTPCDVVEERDEQYWQRTTDRRSCGTQEVEPMDVDVATVTQSAPIPTMIHAEVLNDEQSRNSDVVPIMNTTLTKTGRKRAPIPSILLDQNLYPTASISDTPASYIPMTTEMTTEISATTPTHLATPPRTLRRQKKRLSLSNLATNTRAISLGPPDPPICFSPPPIQTSSSPQFTPTLPTIITPPQSPGQNLPYPVLSPAIVISAAAATTPTTTIPSTPVTPLTLHPSQSLPRIGTPKRPYYSTIRASMNGRPGPGPSQLSTPPASPSSRSSGRTLGSPESISHTRLSAGVAQTSTSMIEDGTSMAVDGVGTHRPASTSAIVTVPPLPPVIDIPIPTSVPVPRHMRPSSPVRSIPSVLDPVNGDDDKDEEDEEMPYREFGMGSTSRFGRMLRERRSGNLKDKGKSRGDKGGGGYHFALSFSRSLGRKRGGACAGFAQESEEREPDPPLPTLSMNRGYAGVGGFGPGRGCSMSGEMEMRMALAERNVNAESDNENGLNAAFKFRENQRPSCDGDGRTNRGKGRKLIKMRSTIGLTSGSFTASPSSSPSSKPRIGSRLKEMSFSFLGRFQGGEASRS